MRLLSSSYSPILANKENGFRKNPYIKIIPPIKRDYAVLEPREKDFF